MIKHKRRNDNALPPSKYYEYIQSEAWKRKRRSFFSSKLYNTYPTGKRAGKFVCYHCGVDGNLHLHHRTYKRLGCELINVDLIPLCVECHSKVHRRIKSNSRLTLWDATKKNLS